MSGNVNEINGDSTNNPTNMPNVTGSGLIPGFESGLSSVEAIANGGIQPEQETSGDGFRQVTEKAATKGNGKTFTIGR